MFVALNIFICLNYVDNDKTALPKLIWAHTKTFYFMFLPYKIMFMLLVKRVEFHEVKFPFTVLFIQIQLFVNYTSINLEKNSEV